MKRLIKRAAKGAWNLTGPLRRPIMRRVDAKLQRVISNAVVSSRDATGVSPESLRHHIDATERAFEHLQYSLGALHHKTDQASTEIDIVLNTLVREIARLQQQVDALHDAVDAATSNRAIGLAVVADSEPMTPARVG